MKKRYYIVPIMQLEQFIHTTALTAYQENPSLLDSCFVERKETYEEAVQFLETYPINFETHGACTIVPFYSSNYDKSQG